MGLKKLSLAELAEFDDGRVRVAWDQALQRAIDDCADRPGVEKPRTVVLVASFAPVASEGGKLRDVTTEFEIKETSPGRRSAPYAMAARPGGLFFSEFSPDEVDQASLEFTMPRDATPASPPAAEKGKGVANG